MTQANTAPVPSTRYRLPDTRPSLTHKRNICGYKCYFTVSFFDDGKENDRTRPAEVFVQIAKQGSIVSGLMDGMATMVSIALQYGIPWEVIRNKLLHHKFGNEAGDSEHTSLYDGLAKAVDHLCAERANIVGEAIPPIGYCSYCHAKTGEAHSPECDKRHADRNTTTNENAKTGSD